MPYREWQIKCPDHLLRSSALSVLSIAMQALLIVEFFQCSELPGEPVHRIQSVGVFHAPNLLSYLHDLPLYFLGLGISLRVVKHPSLSIPVG